MTSKVQLDGSPVELDDIVWDFILHTGRVVSINADHSFVVVFGDRQMTYQQGGYFSGVKRLFWRDPVLMVPQKGSSSKWDIIRGVIAYLDKVL